MGTFQQSVPVRWVLFNKTHGTKAMKIVNVITLTVHVLRDRMKKDFLTMDCAWYSIIFYNVNYDFNYKFTIISTEDRY